MYITGCGNFESSQCIPPAGDGGPCQRAPAALASRDDQQDLVTVSVLHRLRRRERRLALGVLPLFCLVWLQLAAAPCAAFHDTPTQAHQHGASAGDAGAGGHGHEPAGDPAAPQGSGDAPPCAWCPPQDGTDHCADGSRCAFPHEPQVDARVPMVFLPAPDAPTHPVTADAPVELLRATEERPGPIPRRSLAIHYCRFIE
jgi:hypothetical protein